MAAISGNELECLLRVLRRRGRDNKTIAGPTDALSTIEGLSLRMRAILLVPKLKPLVCSEQFITWDGR
jgi:hypothetical protein